MMTLPAAGHAAPGGSDVVQNPYHDPHPEPVRIDLRPGAERHRPLIDPPYPSAVPFGQLDTYIRPVLEPDDPAPAGVDRASLPAGFAQVGGMIVPEAMLHGADMVPDAEFALTSELEPSKDIEDFCAFPEEVPPGIYDYDPRPGGETPRFHTVYMNFTGGVLMSGGENSAENLSGIARTGHPYPIYGGGEAKAIAVSQAVQQDFEKWAVRVVYLERPPKVLPYTMVMMGGHYSDTTAGPSGGVAPLDCEDFGQRNVCYAFQNTSPTTSQANVASQEIGHTLGLGHTSATDSVMAAGYAPTQGGDLGLNDSCASTINVSDQGAACTGVNKCHCGVGDAQHDVNTLFATFAPAGVDMGEPTIELLTPADGEHFSPEDEIVVEFDPWDDFGGYGWKLVIEDEAGEVIVDQVDYEKALMFTLSGLEPGTYTIRGIIQDHADHVVEHAITIVVDAPEGESGTGTAGETDGDTDGESAGSGTGDSGALDGGSTSDGSGGSEGDTAGADGSDDGCGCQSKAPGSGSLLGLLTVSLLGLRRRRRSTGNRTSTAQRTRCTEETPRGD